MEFHAQERQNQCNICGKIFNYKSDHMHHIVSQLGEMQFHCPECGNCLKDESLLFKHSAYGGMPTPLCSVWKVFQNQVQFDCSPSIALAR